MIDEIDDLDIQTKNNLEIYLKQMMYLFKYTSNDYFDNETPYKDLSDKLLYSNFCKTDINYILKNSGVEGVEALLQEVAIRICKANNIKKVPIIVFTDDMPSQSYGRIERFSDKISINISALDIIENYNESADYECLRLLRTLRHELSHYECKLAELKFLSKGITRNDNVENVCVSSTLFTFMNDIIYGRMYQMKLSGYAPDKKALQNCIDMFDKTRQLGYYNPSEFVVSLVALQFVKDLNDKGYVNNSAYKDFLMCGIKENSRYNFLDYNEKYAKYAKNSVDLIIDSFFAELKRVPEFERALDLYKQCDWDNYSKIILKMKNIFKASYNIAAYNNKIETEESKVEI